MNESKIFSIQLSKAMGLGIIIDFDDYAIYLKILPFTFCFEPKGKFGFEWQNAWGFTTKEF